MSYTEAADIAPTPERIRNAPFGIDGPTVDRQTDRRAHAVRDIFGDLLRRRQITEEECSAGKRFSRHRELAYRGRSVTPSYGQRFAEGTPPGQMSDNAAEEDCARVIDYVVLHTDARQALPTTARLAMTMAADGHAIHKIGSACSMYRDREKVAAAAVTLLKSACEILLTHYTTRRTGPP